MTGVSYMIPFVVAGGLLIAISFAVGGINVFEDANAGTLGWTLVPNRRESGLYPDGADSRRVHCLFHR
jgi:fructose-specific phosphotransferase system IIC component